MDKHAQRMLAEAIEARNAFHAACARLAESFDPDILQMVRIGRRYIREGDHQARMHDDWEDAS